MSLFNSYDRTKFLDELNHPVHTGSGIVSSADAQTKARTNLGAAGTAVATTTVAGLVKQGVNVAEAAGDNPTAAEYKALLDALKDAGILVPDA